MGQRMESAVGFLLGLLLLVGCYYGVVGILKVVTPPRVVPENRVQKCIDEYGIQYCREIVCQGKYSRPTRDEDEAVVNEINLRRCFEGREPVRSE